MTDRSSASAPIYPINPGIGYPYLKPQ